MEKSDRIKMLESTNEQLAKDLNEKREENVQLKKELRFVEIKNFNLLSENKKLKNDMIAIAAIGKENANHLVPFYENVTKILHITGQTLTRCSNNTNFNKIESCSKTENSLQELSNESNMCTLRLKAQHDIEPLKTPNSEDLENEKLPSYNGSDKLLSDILEETNISNTIHEKTRSDSNILLQASRSKITERVTKSLAKKGKLETSCSFTQLPPNNHSTPFITKKTPKKSQQLIDSEISTSVEAEKSTPKSSTRRELSSTEFSAPTKSIKSFEVSATNKTINTPKNFVTGRDKHRTFEISDDKTPVLKEKRKKKSDSPKFVTRTRFQRAAKPKTLKEPSLGRKMRQE